MVTVLLIDDLADVFAGMITSHLSNVNVRSYSLDVLKGFVHDQDLMQYLADSNDIIFYDGTYRTSGLTAINVFDKTPSSGVTKKILMAEDVAKYMDKYSKEWQDLFVKRDASVVTYDAKTDDAPWTGKCNVMIKMILDKSTELGKMTREKMQEGDARPELVQELHQLNIGVSKLLDDADALVKDISRILDFEPQSESEASVMEMLKSLQVRLVHHVGHSVGQSGLFLASSSAKAIQGGGVYGAKKSQGDVQGK